MAEKFNPPGPWVAPRRAQDMRNKLKLLVASVLAVATTASADVASAVTIAATEATVTINAIIGAVTPIVFLVVVAIVGISAGKKLLSKGQ